MYAVQNTMNHRSVKPMNDQGCGLTLSYPF